MKECLSQNTFLKKKKRIFRMEKTPLFRLKVRNYNFILASAEWHYHCLPRLDLLDHAIESRQGICM
jgi:hypothetical protein